MQADKGTFETKERKMQRLANVHTNEIKTGMKKVKSSSHHA
jgi:hypothetical protein